MDETIKDIENAANVAKELKNEDTNADIFNKISEATLSILSGPVFQEGFTNIKNALGDQIAENILGMISVAMTTASYNAVVQYHNNVMQLLSDQVDEIAGAINTINAEIHGTQQAVAILRKSISELEKRNIVEKVKK